NVFTQGDGDYAFLNVPAGTYRVTIDTATLPGGATPTYDLDGVATPHTTVVTQASGSSRTDVDFGYQGDASVGDRVWNDLNGNGAQDAGEAGINGVTVQLFDFNGNLVGTTVTSGNGNYTFTHVLANEFADDTYTVQIVTSTLPAGYVETYDLDDSTGPFNTPDAAAVHVNAGDHLTNVDFGYRSTATASVGDRVWLDSNGNTLQDARETGLNGVTVQLLDGGGNVVRTTTTAGDGNYQFDHLVAGTYSVRIVPMTLPAGVTPTYDLDGTATPNIATFTLAAGAARTDVDFGYRGTASVGDRVWLDSNANGVQDVGEPGINGVTVQLLDSGSNVIATTTTAGDGLYTFANLLGGTYSVRVVASSLPAGVGPTYDLDGIATPNIATFTLAAGANRTDVDFGYGGTASVGDRVWLDANGNGGQDAGEAGLNGVTVQLLDSSGNVTATATTAGDGNYTFFNLVAGNYSVKVVASTLPAGMAPTYDLDGIATPNIATFTLAAGANRTDVDFGYRIPDACVNGPIGGIDLGVLPKYLFLFADGIQGASWQGATKGFVGNVAVDGLSASERTSGRVAYAGTIFTNDSSLGAWQSIVNQNASQASASTGNTSLISSLKGSLTAAFAQINSLPATPGYESVSSTSLNGLNTTDGVAKTYVINVTSGFQVSSQINITGDPGDVFILRWDSDHNFNNGYQGMVKFQSGGAIVPYGGLTPASFIHVAGDIDASGGGSNPAAPYPQGPRLNDGTGALIRGGSNFQGGG